ncbi:MAG: hypothetical protein HQ477_02010 [Chloroflexi bacterium]|nr:hypothetical protein [Chloroflexota bacterium]
MTDYEDPTTEPPFDGSLRELIDLKEVCKRLSIGMSQLDKYVLKPGHIEVLKIGHKHLVAIQALQEYVQRLRDEHATNKIVPLGRKVS